MIILSIDNWILYIVEEEKMKINWGILVDKFGMDEATKRFEKLALHYVQRNYTEYEWVLTQRTRDNNRDIHLKEYEDGEIPTYLDRWAEAKYKQKSNSLRKKDIDPTILSGLIDGNVELIIFISNGSIPVSLLKRSYLGTHIKNIEVTYILKTQLENWLISNPEIYQEIFDEPINKKIKEKKIINIEYISFDQIYNKAISFSPTTYFRVGNKYVLHIFIYSTYKTSGKIVKGNSSFCFLEDNDNYTDPNQFSILPGINKLSFLILANKPFKGSITYTFNIDNEQYNVNSKRIAISDEKLIQLSYPEQLSFSQDINNMILLHEKINSQQIITIYGKTGIGKSTLIKNIFEQNYLKHDIIVIDFKENTLSGINNNYNYTLLCKFAVYISLGNLSFQINNMKQEEFKKNIQRELSSKKYNEVFLDLIDGCYDSRIAEKTILNFMNKIVDNGAQEEKNFYPLLFIFDNVQYLSSDEAKFFYKLLEYDKDHNKNIIVLSATEGRFDNDKLQNSYLHLPNLFELTGLQETDIYISMQNNIENYEEIKNYFIAYDFLKNPLFLKEYIYHIQIASSKENIKNLIIRNEPFITSNSINEMNRFFYLLDIIYQFQNGIKRKYVLQYFKKSMQENEQKIKKDLSFLEKYHFIFLENGIIYPYHDYVKKLYLKTRGKNIYNKNNSRFYQFVYENYTDDISLDDYHILNLIILSDKTKYTFYKKELIKVFYKYIDQTKYYFAYEIGEILYNKIIGKRKKTEEDCNILYLYTDCVNHCCNNNDLVLEKLKSIEKHSDNNLLLKLEVKASILNELFWQLKIGKQYFTDASILELDIENGLNVTKSLKSKKRLKRALYTCLNRNMAANLLIDNYNNADKLIKKGVEVLKENNINNLDSEKATYYMDYARGITFHDSNKSYKYMKKSLSWFNTDKNAHYRRILICKIDIEVQKSINDLNVDFRKFDKKLKNLFDNNFKSECYKAILKRFACYLTYIHKDNCISENSLNSLYDKINIALYNLDYCMNNRDKFLYNQIFAILLIKKDPKKALKLLYENTKLILNLGDSYKTINKHNIDNIESINYISWAKEKEALKKETYYLDPRFW